LGSALGSLAIFIFCSAAQAASYGNFVGPNVAYMNVNEADSQLVGPPPVTTSPAQLYGLPALSPTGGDNLAFPNLSFTSLAASGQFEFLDGKLAMDIAPTTSSAFIHSLNIDEGGAWRVLGPAGNTASSEATLLVNDLRITSLNGTPLATPIIVTPSFNVTYNVQVGSANVTTGVGDFTVSAIASNAAGTWDIDAYFNLDAALAAAGETGARITDMSLALDNQLLTQTTSEATLTLAEIDKKHFDISENVPEPATISLLAFGSLLMLRRSARR